jgi:glycosyltransferase involved in cell wall biosynthesis
LLEAIKKNKDYEDYKMYKNQKVSIIFPTYNEKDSIREACDEFLANEYVDEVLVVNNNAAEGTKEEVEKTKARQVFEKKQGYGFAIRRGFEDATGDIVIVSEPDGTFHAKDVTKLLAYSEDFDVVFGTRTTRALILEGANMGFFLKWGNWFVAKIMEVLYNTTHLSDVGCTMRLLKKNVVEKLKPKFTVGTSHFGPELMLLVVLNKIKFVEVPVNYGLRVGESSVTGSFWKALILGFQMIGLILEYRIKSIFIDYSK